MKIRVLLFLLTLLLLLPYIANAQGGQGGLDFTISPPDITVFQGDMFTISVSLLNSSPIGSMQNYFVSEMYTVTYTNMITGANVDLSSINIDQGTDFGTVTNRLYAPGDTATAANFLKFSTDTSTPTGDYTANVELDDNTGASVANASFNVHIQAVPEFGTTLSVAGLLCAGAYGLWRQRRQRRPNAAGSETPRLKP